MLVRSFTAAIILREVPDAITFFVSLAGDETMPKEALSLQLCLRIVLATRGPRLSPPLAPMGAPAKVGEGDVASPSESVPQPCKKRISEARVAERCRADRDE